MLAQRIEEEQRSGRLPPAIDARALAVALTALVDGLLLHRLIDATTPVVDAGQAVASLLMGDPNA